MGFRRQIQPETLPSEETLTSAMVSIGMIFAAKSGPDANIEDVLLAASLEGMENLDFRTLSVLTTWLGQHIPRVNISRLARLIERRSEVRLKAYWASIAKWHQQDTRLRKIAALHSGDPVDLLPTGTDFQLRRRGGDPRFEKGPLRVPAGTLRDRAADILSPAELARVHRAYHFRVLIGPTYRADMWALLEAEPELTASELARRTYGSFATAWQVKQDFEVLSESPEPLSATA